MTDAAGRVKKYFSESGFNLFIRGHIDRKKSRPNSTLLTKMGGYTHCPVNELVPLYAINPDSSESRGMQLVLGELVR